MKEKIMEHFPFICTYYTIIIMVSSIYNLAMGNTLMETGWFVELFAFLVIFVLIDQLLERINFKSFWSCALAQTGVAYVLFLIGAYLFKWVEFAPLELLWGTALFIIIAAVGIAYFNYRNKLRTQEINELLKKNR